MDIALLRRIPNNHSKRGTIEDDLIGRKVGFRGEQNVKYHLELLPENDDYIIYNLRLPFGTHFFQIDTLLLSTNFILIMEVKNYSGTLIFEKHSDQLLRIFQNKEENFPNPIFQAQRHHFQFERFLKNYNVPSIPIEHYVIISNPSTKISTTSDNLQLYETVFHAEKIISKVQNLNTKHTKTKLKPNNLKKIAKLLVDQHKPDIPNILDQYGITKEEIIKGVHCPFCQNIPMLRQRGTWFCSRCQSHSKNAHEQAILDYLLLINTVMGNQHCQDFLQLPNRRVVASLLSSMNLPTSGHDGGRKYHRPSIEYLQEKFSHLI